MTLINGFGAALDAAIGIFSPQKALYRKLYREKLNRLRSAKYAAAQTTRLTGGWSPVDSDVNTVIGNSAATVRARVRQLVRDFPYFARAVNIVTGRSVGSGIVLQSRVPNNTDGRLDKRRIQQIEDAFNFWADEADIAGKLHYYEIMELAKKQDLECGEFLIIKTMSRDRSRYLPYALQVIEADWLTDFGATPRNPANKIEQGIEYDPQTGRVLAYHLTDPRNYRNARRVAAAEGLHGYQTLRPGQLRGISPFAPGVIVANDLQSIMEAEIDASKLASKYLAMVKTPDPLFRQNQVGAANDPETGQKIEELENAIIEYLRPGEDVTIAHNPRPGTNFPPFVRLVLTMFAVVAGVPYELLSGDYRGLNYSTGKMIRNDFVDDLRPISVRHVRHFAMKTFIPFMDAAVLAGKLDLPGYQNNPVPYLKSEWQPPGMESIDPLRESKARIDEVKSGLRSPQEIARARGRNLEDIYKEIAEAKEMAEEMGLSFEEVSTALANNPDAVEGQKSLDETLVVQLLDKLDELAGQPV